MDKSINLDVENRDTTAIDGMNIDDPIWIKTSSVSVSGFTLANGGASEGIDVIEKKWWFPDDPPMILTGINISSCIIQNNRCGIRLDNTDTVNISNCIIINNLHNSMYILHSSYVTINQCEIHDNGEGGYSGGIDICHNDFGGCDHIEITECNISNNNLMGITINQDSSNIDVHHNNLSGNTWFGIMVGGGLIFQRLSSITIHDNIITGNGREGATGDGGIYLQNCKNCVTVKNNNIIANNPNGVYLSMSCGNTIVENNFVDNIQNAGLHQLSITNHWDNNYWDDWEGLTSGVKLPKVIRGKLWARWIPWVNFDWHPAEEPYEI